MAEFTKNEVQIILPNQVVTLNTSIGCNKGYVYHRNGSGIVTLRGITNNCFARYQVTFNGNIAVPSTGTAGPIAVALALDLILLVDLTSLVIPVVVFLQLVDELVVELVWP